MTKKSAKSEHQSLKKWLNIIRHNAKRLQMRKTSNNFISIIRTNNDLYYLINYSLTRFMIRLHKESNQMSLWHMTCNTMLDILNSCICWFIFHSISDEDRRIEYWFIDSLRIQQQKARWNTSQSSCKFYQRILIHTADCDWQKQHRYNLTLKTWMSEKAMIENCALCESWNTIRRASEKIENSW